jgi:hypothetical protein
MIVERMNKVIKAYLILYLEKRDLRNIIFLVDFQEAIIHLNFQNIIHLMQNKAFTIDSVDLFMNILII